MRCVALIRGINVGGNNRLPMADLRALCLRLGFGEPKTLLQSGNVVFKTNLDPKETEIALEEATQAQLGLKVAYIVRSHAEIQAIVANNPFTQEAKTDPSHLVVAFLKNERQPEAVLEWPGPEAFSLSERHLYVTYPNGIGTSKMPGTLIEKTFGSCTARNWNTILKMRELLNAE